MCITGTKSEVKNIRGALALDTELHSALPKFLKEFCIIYASPTNDEASLILHAIPHKMFLN